LSFGAFYKKGSAERGTIWFARGGTVLEINILEWFAYHIAIGFDSSWGPLGKSHPNQSAASAISVLRILESASVIGAFHKSGGCI
jgi:hypothetical protein